MTTYRTRPMTDAVLALLLAAGLRVGDGDKPVTGGWQGTAGASTFNAYVVLHAIGAADVSGTLNDPWLDAWPLWQVTAYGANRIQCEVTADAARAAMLGTRLVATGIHFGITGIVAQGIVTRIDDVQPPIFMSPDRYTAFTTS